MSKTFRIVLVAATAALAFVTSDASVLRGSESRRLSATHAEAVDIDSTLREEARHLMERVLGQIDGDSPDTSSSATTAGNSTTDIGVGSSDAIDITTATIGSSDADTDSGSTAGIQQEDPSKEPKYEQKCWYL